MDSEGVAGSSHRETRSTHRVSFHHSPANTNQMSNSTLALGKEASKLSDNTPRSSADSSVIDEGFYCKISLDCDGSYDKVHVPNFEAVLGSKEHCVEKEHWFRSLIWGFWDAVAAGLVYAAAVSATFGFILPSVEVLVSEILGQRPVNNFLDASGISQTVWLISAAISGLALGFTHAAVSESVATYLEQFTGFTTFEDIRPKNRTVGERAQNLALDVISEDAIIIVSFAASLSLAAVAFLDTGVSPVVVQFTSCVIGGIFVGAILLVLQKSRKRSYASQRRERLRAGDRQTFFTIFEEKIGAVIRQEDFRLWANVFLARVFAGVAFRPIAIVTGALVQSKLKGDGFSERCIISLSSFTSVVTLLSGWYASIRLSDWLVRRRQSLDSGDPGLS